MGNLKENFWGQKVQVSSNRGLLTNKNAQQPANMDNIGC